MSKFNDHHRIKAAVINFMEEEVGIPFNWLDIVGEEEVREDEFIFSLVSVINDAIYKVSVIKAYNPQGRVKGIIVELVD